MENQAKTKSNWSNQLADWVLAGIALIAAIVLALDSTGLIAIPWIQSNLSELTFVAVCLLILLSVVDRRVALRSLEEKLDSRLGELEKQSRTINDGLSGVVSVDTMFKNRLDYTSLERRLNEVKDIWFSGQSLIGVVSAHHSLFRKLAREGHRFRFLLEDPSHCSQKDEEEIKQTLNFLVSIKKETPSQIEIRLTPAILHFSLLLTDRNKQSGRIQVEFYAYQIATSDRPHVNILPARDPVWYRFYQEQFESLWNNAMVYDGS
jgi:hypothetical protein